MKIRLLLALGGLLLVGCPQDDDDDDVTQDDDDTTQDDDDSAGDDDDSAAATLVDLALEASATEITSRETVTFTVTAVYSDATEVDVSSQAVFSSDDTAVLAFFAPDVGQPLLAGTAAVTASWSGEQTDSVAITVTVADATAGDLVINEFLADGAVDGDPNGDGSTDSVEDEFLEVANVADATVDLGGVTIVETDWPFLPRHTFADGTVLQAGEAIVVFGGGDVGSLYAPFAWFVVAENTDPGIQNGLSLSNVGDVISVIAADGATVITELAYGDESSGGVPAPADQSAVLTPEVWGTDYVEHDDAAGSTGSFSPGTLSTGDDFEGPDGRYGG